MYNQMIKSILLFIGISLLLTSCLLMEKDNTPAPMPLTTFITEIKLTRLWSAHIGSETNNDHLCMRPILGKTAIFITNASGTVTSTNKFTGHINWQVNTKLPLTTSPGIGENILVVGSHQGNIIAL